MTIERIGIIGAGTMGSGIALTALYAGLDVTLYDLYPQALEKAQAYVEKFLAKKDQLDALEKLTLVSELSAMHDRQVIIEAALEDKAVKLDIFAQLDDICTEDAIIATNTSTITVSGMAAETKHPARVLGMHFFNPAPVMKLVEVIRATQTNDAVVQTIVQLAETMGKTPVIATDSPGFIVNRVARHFYLEALRILSEGIATIEQVDTIMQLAGGFRMGPFRLMDLIGIDINFAASVSVYEQTFHEPRFRPSLLQTQMVEANKLGRKTGQGWYRYGDNAPQFELPVTPEKQSQSGTIYAPVANALTARAEEAGYTISQSDTDATICILDTMPEHLPTADLVLVNAATIPIQSINAETDSVIGYDDTFLETAKAVTLTKNASTSEMLSNKAQAFFTELGLAVIWLEAHPGLILSRIACQIINEAAFAVGEGVAEATMIDTAMKLGVNYPGGPFEWAERIGLQRVIQTLDNLYDFYHEDRYRVAPQLRRWAAPQK